MGQVLKNFGMGCFKVIDKWGNMFMVRDNGDKISINPLMVDGEWEDVWNERLNCQTEGDIEDVLKYIELYYDYDIAEVYSKRAFKLEAWYKGKDWMWGDDVEDIKNFLELWYEGDIKLMCCDLRKNFNFGLEEKDE